MYTEVSLFQGVGIVYRGVISLRVKIKVSILISGCWNRCGRGELRG